jgi:hypothetical protein
VTYVIADNGYKNRKNYLHERADLAHKFGIATGCR